MLRHLPRPAPVARLLLGLLLLLAIAAPPQTLAQTRAPASPPASAEAVIKPELQDRLRSTIDSIERRQRELAELRKLRAKEPSPELEKEIEQLSQQISDLRQQFVGLATNDFTLLQPGAAAQGINWQDELIQVIYPLLRELNALTAKPRQIEKLKLEISRLRSENAVLAAALTQLEGTLTDTRDSAVRRSLTALQQELRERSADNEQKLAAQQYQLDELERETKPLLTSMLNGARSFVTNIGLHLGLAIGLGAVGFSLVQLIGRAAMRIAHGKREERKGSLGGLLTFSIKVISWLTALFVYLMVLYALDSWVILGLTVIVLLAAIFSLKDVLPDYLVEIRTLLDFGSIRQGERLAFKGLVWRIADLDVYTTLHNPALDGLLRVPLTQISRLSSRPYHKEEPWFPSQTGDWLLMSDGAYGQVRLQTPDLVQLNFGESTINYRTEDFLSARPQNLSSGFPAVTTFRLDYRHQSEATTTIPQRLRDDLEQRMAGQKDFGHLCTEISVEFSGVNDSALNYRIIALFSGAAADRYYRIQRWLQRCAVDSANRHGWTVPSQRIAVHPAHPADNAPGVSPTLDNDG